MSLKTMPGSGGAGAFQRDPKALCARQEAGYECAKGHSFTLTFAAEVDPPERARVRRDEHMARVFERRTIAELEELLTERLAQLRAGRRAA
jgi:hypothetical protein